MEKKGIILGVKDELTVNSKGVMEFELSGCVLAKNRKQVEEIVERQIARSVAGEDFQDPIAEWIFLSFNVHKMRTRTNDNFFSCPIAQL